MPLLGTLSTMPLTDLLQWVASARLTGTLQIEREKVSKSIVFQDGEIIGCSSDDPPERLGQFLIARGKISEELLCHALTIQESTRRHLGMTLVEMGALSADELSSHLEAKAEETVFSLFGWDDAVFRFQQGLRDEANVFPISLRVEDVLLRGLKRFDEIQRIREVLYDPRLVLRRTAKPAPPALVAKPMARTLIEAIDGDRTVSEIRLHVHGSEFVVSKFLFELYQAGLVEVVGIKKIEPIADRGTEAPPVAAPRAVAGDAAFPVPPDDADFSNLLPPDTQAATEPQVAAETATATARDRATVRGDVEIRGELESADTSDAYQLSHRLERARVHMRGGEFEQALVILDELYERFPGDESLRRLTAEAETAFIEKAYRYFLPKAKIPRLSGSVDVLAGTAMSSTEFFLLSRIDGSWDVKSIVQIAPLREAETLRTLKRMREAGIIELVDPEDS